MIPQVVDVIHLRDYVLFVRFQDGVEGAVDLKNELWGPIFEPLRDVGQFRKVRVHPDIHTVVWENGADFAPEFLYEEVLHPGTRPESQK